MLVIVLDGIVAEVVVVDGVVAPVTSVVARGDVVLFVVELVTLVCVVSGNIIAVD